jgi:hypothetical protein
LCHNKWALAAIASYVASSIFGFYFTFHGIDKETARIFYSSPSSVNSSDNATAVNNEIQSTVAVVTSLLSTLIALIWMVIFVTPAIYCNERVCSRIQDAVVSFLDSLPKTALTDQNRTL